MGATFSRLKNWTTEVLTNTDLNLEIDNILNNLGPAGVDDYSTNVAQMKLTTDPGELATESLATSLAGEVERLRFVIKEMKGDVSQWYSSSSYSLSSLGSAFGGGLPTNRVISGRNRTASGQAIALVPAGNARTATLKGATTSYIYSILNTQYSVTADVNITALTTAAATNNTCLINDDGLAGEEHTKYIGEFGTDLVVDAMGSNISALTGKLAGFSLVSGGSTEYFVARVESSTRLTSINRGYFFDSADAPISRIACSDNNTISLMKLTWLFVNTSGTLLATYNEPRVSKEEPGSPAAGDYWFDLANTAWKSFSSSWSNASATLVGYCMQNQTATMCARSIDYYKAQDDVNNIDLMIYDATEIRSTRRGCRVVVNGSPVYFEEDYVRWDMDTDLDTGLTEAASTQYFLYVSEAGKPIISTVVPAERPEFRGMYHPHHTWICVGQAFNNASSDLTSVISYLNNGEDNYVIENSVASNALILRMLAPPQQRFSIRNATATSGVPQSVRVLPGHNMTVAAGSTLGTESATDSQLFQYMLGYNGRAEPGISSEVFPSTHLANSTAEAGNGDDAFTLYSKASRTGVPVRTIAALVSSQTNAGTWAAVPTVTKTTPYGLAVQRIRTYSTPGTYSLVVPALVYSMDSELIAGGGGGGGGGSTSGTFAGGGGGGGNGVVPYNQVIPVVPNETLSLVVGAAGVGGGGALATNSTAGTAGGATYIQRGGIDVLRVRGGLGGNFGAWNNGTAAGGAALSGGFSLLGSYSTSGAGGTGFFNTTGNNGTTADSTLYGAGGTGGVGNAGGGGGGGGGGAGLGTGGSGGNGHTSNGTAATGFGGGGGGGGGSNNNGSGGGAGMSGANGTGGRIRLTWSTTT